MNKTGNPVGSKAFLDFEDNVQILDQRLTSDQDTFQDRLGRSRLTWAGIVRAGTGDPAIAVDAADRAVDAADRAESAASSVEQDAEQIAQDAAQQAVDGVVVAVDGAVDRAEGAADRAESARDAAFVNADVYPGVATGRAAVANGEQFQVVNGDTIVRYRRDSASTQTQMAHYPSTGLVYRVREEAVRSDQIVQQSTNLATRAGQLLGKLILADGTISDNATYNTSDFIPVTPGATYTSRAYLYVAEYSAAKEFIRRKSPPGILDGDPWQASDDAFFVRFSHQPGRSDAGQRQLNAGPVLLPFENHYIRIRPTAFAEGSIYGAVLADHSVSARKTDFAETGLNLFNPDSVTVGKIIRADGSIEDVPNYSITGFIDVEPGETYSKAGDGFGFTDIAEYDSGGNFLRRTVFTGPVTLTENTSLVRLNLQGSLGLNRMFYKGSDPVEYEPYKVVIKGLELPVRSGAFVYPFSAEGVFEGIDYSSWWPGFGQSTLSGEVYQRWDDLAADYPDVITKQVLGEDDFGNEISAYHISAGSPSSTAALKKPKIFTVSSIHGYEKAPALVTYLFYRDMLERANVSKELSALMYNADHIIIPVANPSGFNLYQRKNGNGVDLNRNFPEGWVLGDPSSSTYGGPAALSELEAQYISQVMDENPDISICNDFHNFHGTGSTTDFIWVATGAGAHTQHMAASLIERMTSKWRPEYPWFPQDRSFFAGYTDGTAGAMVQDHARARGVTFTALFEICYRWWLDPDGTAYDAVVQKTGVETWANWLLISLRELEKITYR